MQKDDVIQDCDYVEWEWNFATPGIFLWTTMMNVENLSVIRWRSYLIIPWQINNIKSADPEVKSTGYM